MMNLTRRNLFAGAAAAGAATALTPFAGRSAQGAEPPAGKQAPGIYRYKIGDYEVTQVADGARTFPMPDNFVTGATPAEAKKALTDAYMPEGKLTIMFNPMVVNTGSKLVLIDTGNGPGAYAADQRRGRSVARQSRSGRHRPQGDRHRADLAHARRSHQRHAATRTARPPSRMPRSWCRPANGRSGWTTPTRARRIRITRTTSRT